MSTRKPNRVGQPEHPERGTRTTYSRPNHTGERTRWEKGNEAIDWLLAVRKFGLEQANTMFPDEDHEGGRGVSYYAVMVIAADGATDIIGPYTSETRACRDADRIRDEAAGVSADTYLMDACRNAREYAESPT